MCLKLDDFTWNDPFCIYIKNTYINCGKRGKLHSGDGKLIDVLKSVLSWTARNRT